MTDTLRNVPRYIRNTDAFGWQGADGPDGPWRSITPPQSSAPWQTTSPMDALRQASAEVSGVKVLSPQAQAVLDAFLRAPCDNKLSVAAAVRAAANAVQIKPYTFAHAELWSALLDIALELEGGAQ